MDDHELALIDEPNPFRPLARIHAVRLRKALSGLEIEQKFQMPGTQLDLLVLS